MSSSQVSKSRPGAPWLRLALFGDANGMFKLEGEQGFSGEDDLLIAGEGAAGRTRAAAGESTNSCAFAAAGKSADERAQAGAAADHNAAALAFPLFGFLNAGCLDRVAAPAGMDTIELDHKRRAALEAAQRLGIDHGSVGTRALGDDGLSVNHDVVRDGRLEGVAGVADLRSEIRVKANADAGSHRQFDHFGRRRSSGRGR